MIMALSRSIAATAAGAGVLAMCAPALIAAPVLACLGFGSGGVAAGSAAAAWHATIGNVVAGSAFAVLQSAGAGGAGMVAVGGVVKATGAVVAAVAASASFVMREGHGKGEESGLDA